MRIWWRPTSEWTTYKTSQVTKKIHLVHSNRKQVVETNRVCQGKAQERLHCHHPALACRDPSCRGGFLSFRCKFVNGRCRKLRHITRYMRKVHGKTPWKQNKKAVETIFISYIASGCARWRLHFSRTMPTKRSKSRPQKNRCQQKMDSIPDVKLRRSFPKPPQSSRYCITTAKNTLPRRAAPKGGTSKPGQGH